MQWYDELICCENTDDSRQSNTRNFHFIQVDNSSISVYGQIGNGRLMNKSYKFVFLSTVVSNCVIPLDVFLPSRPAVGTSYLIVGVFIG